MFELGGEAGDAEVGGNAAEVGFGTGEALEVGVDEVRNEQKLCIRDVGPSTGAAGTGARFRVRGEAQQSIILRREGEHAAVFHQLFENGEDAVLDVDGDGGGGGHLAQAIVEEALLDGSFHLQEVDNDVAQAGIRHLEERRQGRRGGVNPVRLTEEGCLLFQRLGGLGLRGGGSRGCGGGHELRQLRLRERPLLYAALQRRVQVLQSALAVLPPIQRPNTQQAPAERGEHGGAQHVAVAGGVGSGVGGAVERDAGQQLIITLRVQHAEVHLEVRDTDVARAAPPEGGQLRLDTGGQGIH